MKFLVDQNLSPLIAVGLAGAGHDALHTRDLGMESASDTALLERAVADGRVIISADTDFGTLLAASRSDRPSVVLIRRTSDRSAHRLLALLLANLETVEAGTAVRNSDAERHRLSWPPDIAATRVLKRAPRISEDPHTSTGHPDAGADPVSRPRV